MQLRIISSATHLSGHYWPYTVEFIKAASTKLPRIEVFTAWKARNAAATSNPNIVWHSCCPWTACLLPIDYRNRNWGSRYDNLLRNLEFHQCLGTARKKTTSPGSGKLHVHCMESRHRLLMNAVLKSDTSFSTLCVGEPPRGMRDSMRDQYRRAFATGRLTFFVETEAVEEAWKELAGSRVIHIPAALPSEEHRAIKQAEARKQLGLPESAFICLFFGTHREGKDYRLAIQAAKASRTNPFLHFVGPLISGNDPQALLNESGYEHSRSQNEFFPDEQVPALFDACDVVMLPYADHYVKGSAVLLQACHFGKPVIATDTGHLREFVMENGNGLLFESGSVRSLADCYDTLASLKQSGDLETHFDFSISRERYSWDGLIDKYLDCFKGLA